MSSFMMKSETLAYIANFIAVQMNHGFNYTGIVADFSCFNDCVKGDCINGRFASAEEIYKKLYQLNFNACHERYDGRYDDEYSMEKFKDIAIHKPLSYADHHAIAEKWHYQMLKSMECYLYQCCEGDCHKSEIYQTVKQFKNNLMCFIVHNSIEWQAAKWE